MGNLFVVLSGLIVNNPLDCVKSIYDTLSGSLRLAPSSLCIEIRVHITGSSILRNLDIGSVESGHYDDKEEEEKRSAFILGLTDVKVTEGRPDIQTLLQEEVGTTTGRIFVGGMSLYINRREAF